jgi:hypothetical protein
MKSQLAPVFEWILEARLYRPFEQIFKNILEFARRNTLEKFRSSKGENTLEGNLLTLSNLVPLFISITFAFLLASLLCLVERKGLRWRALLIKFLTLNRLRLIRVGHLVRSFVSRMIGYVESQLRNLLRYYRDKMQWTSIKKSVNPIILVKSNSSNPSCNKERNTNNS